MCQEKKTSSFMKELRGVGVLYLTGGTGRGGAGRKENVPPTETKFLRGGGFIVIIN